MSSSFNKSVLTSAQRKEAQKHLRIYQFHSGNIGYLLGAPVLILLVISLNGGGYAIGFITAAMQFCTFFGILAPLFLSGRDYVRNKVHFWRLRGSICLLYFVVIFLYEKYFSTQSNGNQYAVIMICIVYGLFNLFRSLGLISLFPVLNASATPQERGKVLSAFAHFGNIGAIFSLIISYFVLHFGFFEKLSNSLLFLIFMGIIFNYFSSAEFNKVSSIGSIPKMEMLEIFQRIKGFLFNKKLFIIWLAKFFADGMIVCYGTSVAYMKKGHGMDDSDIFLFSLVMLLGRIFASSVSGKISDILGTKPILFYIHILIAFCGVGLIYLPVTSSPWVLLVLLVTISFLFCFSDILIGQIVYSYTPKQDILSYSATNTLIAAIAALANFFLIGVILDQNSGMAISFTGIWLLIVFYSGAIVILLFFLSQREEMSIMTVASAFISFRNIRGVFAISALNEEKDKDKKAEYLNHIAVINEPYAQKEIIKYLKSSNMITRRSAYQALRLNPIAAAFDVVFLEAKREDAYIRDDAIYNLRYYPKPEVIEFLRKQSLEENFFGVQAVLSLTYILNKPDDELKYFIKKRLEKEAIPQYRSRMIYSLTKVADIKFCLEVILNEARRKTSKEYIRFLYISLANKYQWSETLELAYNMEDEEPSLGLYEIVSLIESHPDNSEKIEWFMKNDFTVINKWLLENLKKQEMIDPNENLEGVIFPGTCMLFLITLHAACEQGTIPKE
jgi:nitrate/nitrite transporter NarK